MELLDSFYQLKKYIFSNSLSAGAGVIRGSKGISNTIGLAVKSLIEIQWQFLSLSVLMEH